MGSKVANVKSDKVESGRLVLYQRMLTERMERELTIPVKTTKSWYCLLIDEGR